MSEEIMVVAATKRRSKSTEQEKTEWARRFYESGLTQSRFAREQGLAFSTLQRWVSEHRRANPLAGLPAVPSSDGVVPAFTELKLPSSAVEPKWAAELSRPNGTILRLTQQLPAALLEQLLRIC
jgi:transposase-like protein